MKAYYDHQEIEKKWRERWERKNIYEVDTKSAAKPFYCFDMFPYPSGEGLHVGHWRGYVLSDVYARYYRLKGYDVFHPMGFDAFGLNSERAAIKHKSHPKKFTDQAIKTFSRQLDEIGAAFDWTKVLNTSDPAYYHWTQWLFLQFFKHGLAEKRLSLVNWCPNDQTALANEQVINGCCERCGAKVTKKELSQWYLKTTAFTKELLEGLSDVEWPERVKTLQRNWIGESQGVTVRFPLQTPKKHFILLHGFRGSPDTNFFPWLKKELEKLGHTVEVPKLPDSADPMVMNQVSYVLKNCEITASTILLGHSLGAAVALKIAEEKKVSKLILVAGFLEPVFEDHDRPFAKKFNWQFDTEKIKSYADDIVVLSGKNDSAVGPKHGRRLHKKLGARLFEVETVEDHFCGTHEPRVLEQLEDSIAVFTTRPDTLYGVTALVLAPEHPLAGKLVVTDKRKDFAAYQKQVASKTNVDREQTKETAKTAFFTGSYATHPLTGEKLPVWLADYVLIGYGTGAIMAVPAHDERDFVFAKTHHLPIKQVVAPRFVQSTEPGIFRKDEPIVVNDGVIAIIKHWSEDKYLALKWKQVAWVTFLTGTVEEGMTPTETVTKELKEEAGFTNVKVVKELAVADGLFYHVPKQTNKLVHGHIILAELTNGTKSAVSEDENAKHEMVWLTTDELKKFLTPETHQYGLDLLLNGLKPNSEVGSLVNSAEFTGQDGDKAQWEIAKKAGGEKITTHRLRDWLVSRQRYWGAPIPIVYDPEGKAHAVKDEHLPLELPTDVDFLPGGESPLARSKEYIERAEKLYGQGWRFDTDTLDTFVDSSWYFLRYLSPTDSTQAFSPELIKKWLPVDLYIGGIEHATLHLLYARFVTKFLAKYGYIDAKLTEPIKMLYNIGMITLHGAKMSKSKGNIISPDDLVTHYGTDALRGYELFIGPMDIEAEWNPRGINGVHRFLIKIYQLQEKLNSSDAEGPEFAQYLHKIEPMLKEFKLNTVISEAMKLVNYWDTQKHISHRSFLDFLITLSPIFPFVCEELFANNQPNSSRYDGSIFKMRWPEAKEAAVPTVINVLVNQKFVVQFTPTDSSNADKVIQEAKQLQVVREKLADPQEPRFIYKPGQMVNFILTSQK